MCALKNCIYLSHTYHNFSICQLSSFNYAFKIYVLTACFILCQFFFKNVVCNHFFNWILNFPPTSPREVIWIHLIISLKWISLLVAGLIYVPTSVYRLNIFKYREKLQKKKKCRYYLIKRINSLRVNKLYNIFKTEG